MAMPFYVSPDQLMQDKAEYARKGIAKGRSIVVMEFADGLLLTAENPSSSLSKISEIYDRIAFAGVFVKVIERLNLVYTTMLLEFGQHPCNGNNTFGHIRRANP